MFQFLIDSDLEGVGDYDSHVLQAELDHLLEKLSGSIRTALVLPSYITFEFCEAIRKPGTPSSVSETGNLLRDENLIGSGRSSSTIHYSESEVCSEMWTLATLGESF